MDAAAVSALKALVDPTRLRVVGRLADEPATAEDLARDLGLPLQVVVRHLARLRRADVVTVEGGTRGVASLRLDTLQLVGRALDDLERALGGSGGIEPPDGALSPDEAAVLRAYFDGGRLTTIPAHARKRSVVLRWLVDRVFTEDREYPEKEVNQRLAVFHPDVAALRRYMVDARLVSRDHGRYRRATPAPAAPPGDRRSAGQ